MEMLIWLGACVSLVGLAGLILCIVRVWKARRAGLGEADLRAVLQKVVPLNSAALFLSVIGLMLVIVGAALG